MKAVVTNGLSTLMLRIHTIAYEAEGISTFELRSPEGVELPPFTAGAHIEVHIPNGFIRHYSLVNPQSERHRYVIGVSRDRTSRGGSVYMHDKLRVGTCIQTSSPRSNFSLVEDAPKSVFVAGGIGITPLWCMIQRLVEIGQPWQVYYTARTRRHAAFLPQIRSLAAPGQLIENFDEEPGGKMLDVAALVADVPPQAHIYCCGPPPLMKSFEAAAVMRDSDTVHVEYFAARDAPSAALNGQFTVTLQRSGESFAVRADRSILDTLLDAGIPCLHSCKEGICGTCETSVIAGTPEHRDSVLSAAERAANRSMMICVSRCSGESLVLDL